MEGGSGLDDDTPAGDPPMTTDPRDTTRALIEEARTVAVWLADECADGYNEDVEYKDVATHDDVLAFASATIHRLASELERLSGGGGAHNP